MKVAIVPTLALLIGALLGAIGGPAVAQECKPEEIFQVIERTGQRLREINTEGQPRLRAKLQELGRRNGWSDDEIETSGRAVFQDDQTLQLDNRAAELLAELGQLGDLETGSASNCERLAEARTKSAQLVEVTQQRAAHAMARLDMALKPPAPGPAPAPTPPAPSAAQQRVTAAETEPRTLPAPRLKTPAATSPWETQTVREPTPPRPAPAEALPPPAADPVENGFAPHEIRDAGRGFFGTISAGLASVIDHAFQRYGRPSGFVLGAEGGAAFLAGLRYGEGRLVTRRQGDRRVYWQGPSAGFDFGVAGSQVMFLVYNIEDHEQLFQRFSGIDGSAYLVGGVGITFLKRGNVILAPIRTGLGLRVGASIGYLKFTPRPSLNPF
jgi:hypothetical protein